jgi:hypothetical protein
MALTEQHVRSKTAVLQARDEVSRPTSLTLIAAWIGMLVVSAVLEPRTPEPMPLWGWIVGYMQIGLIIATFAGLARRARFGLAASLLGSLTFTAGVFACPATGHHAFGLWWIGEFAASLALVGVSASAYLRRS